MGQIDPYGQEWFRVRDERTGHHYSTPRVGTHHRVLKQNALDRSGNPRPAKTNIRRRPRTENTE